MGVLTGITKSIVGLVHSYLVTQNSVSLTFQNGVAIVLQQQTAGTTITLFTKD